MNQQPTNDLAQLHSALEKYKVIKIQFNFFENWYRINSVEADIVAYTKNGPISEGELYWPQIAGEIAYCLTCQIQSDLVVGQDIANIIPTHIEIVNQDQLDLRTEPGLSYDFEIDQNSGS